MMAALTDAGCMLSSTATNATAVKAIRTGPRGGTPVVLLHSAGLDLTYWDAQLDALRRDLGKRSTSGLPRPRPLHPAKAGHRPKSRHADLSLYQIIRELQLLLATWAGACPTCHRDIPTPMRTRPSPTG